MAVDVLLRLAADGGGISSKPLNLICSRGGTNCSTFRVQRLPNLLPPRNRRRTLRGGEFGAAEVFVDLGQLGLQVAGVAVEDEGGDGLPA